MTFSPCFRGHGQDRVHVGGLAVEMHRDDRFRFRRDPLLHAGHVHVVRPGVDIGKDHPCARLRHRFGCGDEAVGRDDDFVAVSDSQAFERDEEGIGAVTDADAVPDPAKAGKGFLEVLDVGAADEGGLRQDIAR